MPDRSEERGRRLTNRGESGSTIQMSRSTTWIACSVLALTGALAAGCDPTEYTDVNFGTNIGADYMAPDVARDAGMDADAATTTTAADTTADGS